jgi:hypothetical protein
MWWQFVLALTFEAIIIFLALGVGFALGSWRDTKEEPKETSYESTLFTVFHELKEAGLSDNEAQDTIMRMQNAGILFREVAK